MKKTFLRLLGALSAIALTAAGQTHITMMVHTNGTLETPTNFFVANSNLLNQSISLTASGVQVTATNGSTASTNAGVVTVAPTAPLFALSSDAFAATSAQAGFSVRQEATGSYSNEVPYHGATINEMQVNRWFNWVNPAQNTNVVTIVALGDSVFNSSQGSFQYGACYALYPYMDFGGALGSANITFPGYGAITSPGTNVVISGGFGVWVLPSSGITAASLDTNSWQPYYPIPPGEYLTNGFYTNGVFMAFPSNFTTFRLAYFTGPTESSNLSIYTASAWDGALTFVTNVNASNYVWGLVVTNFTMPGGTYPLVTCVGTKTGHVKSLGALNLSGHNWIYYDGSYGGQKLEGLTNVNPMVWSNEMAGMNPSLVLMENHNNTSNELASGGCSNLFAFVQTNLPTASLGAMGSYQSTAGAADQNLVIRQTAILLGLTYFDLFNASANTNDAMNMNWFEAGGLPNIHHYPATLRDGGYVWGEIMDQLHGIPFDNTNCFKGLRFKQSSGLVPATAFGPTIVSDGGATNVNPALTLTNLGISSPVTWYPSSPGTGVLTAPNSTIYDTTSWGQDVGGWLGFGGRFNSGGASTLFGAIGGLKEDGTNNETRGDVGIAATFNSYPSLVVYWRGGDSNMVALGGIIVTNGTNQFIGNGGGLTNLNTEFLTGSALATNLLPGDLPQISTDNLANGTNLNASKLASGTVPLARLNSVVLTNNEAAATTFAGNVTVPTLNSTFLVNVLSFSSDGAQFYSDGAGDVYAPAFVATNVGGYGFVGNGISLTNGNASAFFHSGTVPETRWLSTGAGNASEVIVNNSAGNPVPTNSLWDALLGANLQGWDLIPTNQVIITNGATSGYILQYYQGAMQWIPTNWPASGGGGSSPTFSAQFDNIGGHTNISVAVNLTNIQVSGGATLAGGVTNSSSENVQGGLGVGSLTPPGNGSIVATNNVNVGGILTATNPALYWSGSPTFAIQTGAGSFLASGATATVVSGSVDCAGHLVFVNGSAAATNANGNIIGTVTLAHTAPNTNYQVLFGATGDSSSAWKLQQAYLTATNITTSGFAIAVTGDGAQSFNAAATWGTVYAVYPPIP